MTGALCAPWCAEHRASAPGGLERRFVAVWRSVATDRATWEALPIGVEANQWPGTRRLDPWSSPGRRVSPAWSGARCLPAPPINQPAYHPDDPAEGCNPRPGLITASVRSTRP